MSRSRGILTALFLGLALWTAVPAPVRAETLPVEFVPQVGHSGVVGGISISPDGKVAATASSDNTVRVWDVQSGILLRVLAIGEQASDVGILRDGVRAVVVGLYTVQLWDIAKGTRLTTFKANQGRVRLLHHRDAMVLGDGGGGVELWELTPPKLVHQLDAAKTSGRHIIDDIDVSSDDRTVAVANEDGTIRLIDVQSGRLIHNLTGHEKNVYAARFSKNGQQLTSFGTDNTIRQWNVNNGKELRSYRFDGAIATAALVNDETAVIGCYSGHKPTVFDLTTGRAVRMLEAWPGVPLDGIKRVAVTSDGRRSVATNLGGTVLFSNLEDGTPIHATAEPRTGIFTLALSPQGDKVAVGFGGGEVDLWDVGLGARVNRLPHVLNKYGYGPVAISPDGRLLFRTAESVLYVHDTRSGGQLRRIDLPQYLGGSSIAVSPNGKLVAVCGFRGVAVFGVDSGRVLWSDIQQMQAEVLAFTPDNTQLVVGASNKNTRVYNASDGTLKLQFKGGVVHESIDFLDNNTVLIGASEIFGLWDLRSGQFLRKYPALQFKAGVGAFTVDRKWLVGGDGGGLLTAYDAQAGTRLQPFNAHFDHVKAVVPSRNGKLVFSASFDGTVRVTPLETLTGSDPNSDPRPMVWVADEDDWLAYSTDGNFDASRRGGRLAAAVRGFEGYRIDQLAVRNNRPDLLLGRLGLGTSESVAMYARRYQQRLKRLGLDETALAQNLTTAPHASIVEFSRTGRKARLHCQFAGNGRQLKRYFLFVNDVAVGDGEGKPLSGTEATLELDVELSSGHNKLELSVLNDVGVESFRDVRTVNVTESVRGNLYYLGFGVSRYADPRLTLKYAHKDALDLGRTIKKMAGRGYDHVFSRTLTDAEVTKTSIEAARAFLVKATLDDTVVVFVAGHGVFDKGVNEQYYFVTHDTDISRIHETGVSFDSIENLVTGIAPRKKLLLLDTCQSGERDSDEEVVRVSAGNSRGLVARGIRPVVLGSGSSVGVRPKFASYQDRFIFNDLSRRSGTIVFSASRGSELSYEDDRLRNGIFTSELLHALSDSSADTDKNGSVSTDELRGYVSKAVTKRTEGLQNPTVDRDNLEALFGFPVGTTPDVTKPQQAASAKPKDSPMPPKTIVPATTQTKSAAPKRVIRRLPGSGNTGGSGQSL